MIVEGFRNRVLSYRSSVTPRENWSKADYQAAAEKKRRRFKRLLEQARQWQHSFDDAALLDVGCGDGTNAIQFALEPVREVLGIDLALPLLARDQKGEQTRALAAEILHGQSLPARLRLLEMDATDMTFGDESFDIVISRSAMEHIKPIEGALSEMARVVKHGGLIYLGIDPFYWLRGCHKRGVVDIPFAHARMNLDDYAGFVQTREDQPTAAKRRTRLETLNRFTVAQWREKIESLPCDILSWQIRHSEIGERVLKEFPEISETLLPGISKADLLCERIEVWLRRR
jgi:ubiquinone/menaquinone biosynthesis C-methylase UbiE